MTQLMRKKGEDHLYRYDPVDFDPTIWEIVEDTPAASAKPKRGKPKFAAPAAELEAELEAEEPADDDDDDFSFPVGD